MKCPLFTLGVLISLAGCAAPVIQTKLIDRPVPVFCEIETPPECKTAYALDRVSIADQPLTINRAMRAEIEERSACEIKLSAAIKGCNAVVKVRDGK